jgi:hypothetical protein
MGFQTGCAILAFCESFFGTAIIKSANAMHEISHFTILGIQLFRAIRNGKMFITKRLSERKLNILDCMDTFFWASIVHGKK